MNKSISLKAIFWDIQQMLTSSSYLFRNMWFVTTIMLILFLGAFFNNLLLILIIIVALVLQLQHYKGLKNKEKKNEVIFFQKKKNERERNLYIFFIAMFLAWICRGSISWMLFSLGIGLLFLTKYIYYIPSIVFKAEAYSLLIEKGFRRDRIDFTYSNKIRFVSHRMIFENVLDKKIEIKDVEYLPKLDELKAFLSDNFGREKTVSAANGQPLI